MTSREFLSTSRVLVEGMTGSDVATMQELLAAQGFMKPVTGKGVGVFGPITEDALVYFQQTHIGPDGKPLTADAEAGPATKWALVNPSGAAQTLGIRVPAKKGLTPIRAKVVAIALQEHRLGCHEVPDGSNQGNGVNKYIAGFGAAFWCMLFVSWVRKQAGLPLLGQDQSAHCLTVWKRAQERKVAHVKHLYSPIPGDVFIMLYSKNGSYTGSGHTGIVTGVAMGGRQFNAVEGNAGNRVKQTLHSIEEKTLIGFINDYPATEQERNFERGIVAAATELQTR